MQSSTRRILNSQPAPRAAAHMNSPMDRWIRAHPFVAATIPLGVGLIARTFGIISRPIWYDEAFAILFAEKGFHAMLAGTLEATQAGASDVHPLAYYTMLTGWMRSFGETIPSARLLSVLAGMLTVLVVYILARGLFGAPTALWAGTLVALNPFQVHYSQEIRMYAALGLWQLLATYCFWRGSRTSDWRWWAGFAAFAALAQYTHNLAFFYLFGLAAWPLLRRDWRLLLRVLSAGVAAMILYLPWLLHLPAQFAKVESAYWIETPGIYRLLTLPLVYVTNLPLQPAQLPLGLFTALAVTALALWQTARPTLGSQDPGRSAARWMLYLAFSSPILLFLFSQWRPVYIERALLPAGICYLIWIAWSISEAGRQPSFRYLMVALLVIGFSIGLYQHLTYRGFPYARFGPLVTSLRSQLPADGTIVHSSKLSMLPAVLFDRDLPQAYVADLPGSSVDTLAPATQRVLGLEAAPDLSEAVGDSKHVWFVIFKESNDEAIRAGLARHPQLEWLAKAYTNVQFQDWGSLDVYVFDRE